jgi:hypothetical protein
MHDLIMEDRTIIPMNVKVQRSLSRVHPRFVVVNSTVGFPLRPVFHHGPCIFTMLPHNPRLTSINALPPFPSLPHHHTSHTYTTMNTFLRTHNTAALVKMTSSTTPVPVDMAGTAPQPPVPNDGNRCSYCGKNYSGSSDNCTCNG